jgi:hypothetical protein
MIGAGLGPFLDTIRAEIAATESNIGDEHENYAYPLSLDRAKQCLRVLPLCWPGALLRWLGLRRFNH